MKRRTPQETPKSSPSSRNPSTADIAGRGSASRVNGRFGGQRDEDREVSQFAPSGDRGGANYKTGYEDGLAGHVDTRGLHRPDNAAQIHASANADDQNEGDKDGKR